MFQNGWIIISKAMFMEAYPTGTFHELWCFWQFMNGYISRITVSAQLNCTQNSKATGGGQNFPALETKIRATGHCQ